MGDHIVQEEQEFSSLLSLSHFSTSLPSLSSASFLSPLSLPSPSAPFPSSYPLLKHHSIYNGFLHQAFLPQFHYNTYDSRPSITAPLTSSSFSSQSWCFRLDKARSSLDRFIEKFIDEHIHKRRHKSDGFGHEEKDMVDEVIAFYNVEAKASESEDLQNSSI
ncbi:hypothetical protein K1719_047341 [Acacia pycnantha]|nr:hypothetical protein K1719_047341 [Acacia pycnantha]